MGILNYIRGIKQESKQVLDTQIHNPTHPGILQEIKFRESINIDLHKEVTEFENSIGFLKRRIEENEAVINQLKGLPAK